MIKLQKTIAYGGDLTKTTLKIVNVVFEIPIFEYTAGAEGQVVTRRTTSNLQSDAIQQSPGDKTYQVTLKDNFITGDDAQTLALAKQYSMAALRSGSADNLVVNASVHYLSEAGNALGRQTLDFICLPKLNLQADLATDGEVIGHLQAVLSRCE